MPSPPRTTRAPRKDGYVATTRKVEVRVTPQFDPDRSEPDKGRYFWLYTVEIRNNGRANVQLVARHWRITDALGRLQEVKGEGVVGEQPVIAPAEAFSYTSGCPLPTPTGFMAGTYRMVTDKGAEFDAEIPAFSLDSPYMPRSLN